MCPLKAKLHLFFVSFNPTQYFVFYSIRYDMIKYDVIGFILFYFILFILFYFIYFTLFFFIFT